MLIKDKYEQHKSEVNARFDEIKRNEEELNKIFIDVYGLQGELTADVNNKDVTVTRIYDDKEEIPEEMKSNIYVKTKQDIVKDLISYIVGCCFGRYSPNYKGLMFAGGKFEDIMAPINKYYYHKKLLGDCYCKQLPYIDCAHDTYSNETSTISTLCKHGYGNTTDRTTGCENTNYADCKIVNSYFGANLDNIIPITETQYYNEDLYTRLVDFVVYVYGKEDLNDNLRFIAEALDNSNKYTPQQAIRNYLFNDFFKDHCKKYQNRPIYWLLDSGKSGGFRALMYLHRYDENTLPTARFNYLHDIQWKYEQEKDRLEKIVDNSSVTSERTKAKKELDLINKQIVECQAYDELLNHATNMQIQLNLDDGIKTNYQKLQKIDGDNDKNILSTFLKF